MSVLTVLLQVLLVIVSVLLVGVILLQRNKGQGAGLAFGGMGEAVFGSEMGNVLTRATIVLGIVFLAIVLGLSLITKYGHKANRLDGLDDEVSRQAVEALPVELPAGDAVAGDAAVGGEEAMPASGEEAMPAEPAPVEVPAPAAEPAAPAAPAAPEAPAAPAAPEAPAAETTSK